MTRPRLFLRRSDVRLGSPQRCTARALHITHLSVAFCAVMLAMARPVSADESLPGGAATTKISRSHPDAFSQLSANMPFARELDFKVGNGIFRKLWVAAPSSTKSSDGLGPLFNARACQSCHLKDGRGSPVPQADADRALSILLRLSVPPSTDDERKALSDERIGIVPEPTYGAQLQESAIAGHRAEGRLRLSYEETAVRLSGGETVNLRKPNISVSDLGYGPMTASTMYSLRLTPQMIGLGLLEAIPVKDLLEKEDPDDRNGDGISGRANRVWSASQQSMMLGRFGWKAGQPTVLDQVADAFANDIGIGSSIIPRAHGDCTILQSMCLDTPSGGSAKEPHHEINKTLIDLVAFYSRNLAVPARIDASSATVLKGRDTFTAIGCASCHTPTHRTGNDSPDAHLRDQSIWPYTDLLLHDMGDGLADHRPEWRANGREWRTPPLWGIGLSKIVNGNAFFLHDGRARSLQEAILWHGGEAQQARDGFAGLPKSDRDALIAFLSSL